MTRLRLGRSYWRDASRAHPLRLTSLRGRYAADIAIVGGGITGCAAALLFARAGASVILVDSERLGRGSTAASTALLMQEPDVDLADLAKRYGRSPARRIWNCSRSAVAAMKTTLRALGVEGLHALPSIYYTREAGETKRLRHEAALRRRAGIPSRWLDGDDVRRVAGFDAAGAILTAGNAQVDPYGACVAFARAAQEEGARLYERSAVTRVDGTRDGATLTLEDGRIDAGRAVIATGYATPEFEPLAARFRMMNTYVIATPRLNAKARLSTGFGDVMAWDTERPYHYLRWTADGRLLFGGRDRPRVRGVTRAASLRRRSAELMDDLVELFPSLADMQPDYAWEGLFAATPDGLPYIGTHRRYPGQLFALGYGGNGMTLGYLAAQSLVRIAAGAPIPDDELFGFSRGAGRMS